MCECECVCVCECLRDGLCECACGCGACVREMSVCKTDGRRRCAVGVFGERCDGRLASPQGCTAAGWLKRRARVPVDGGVGVTQSVAR